MKKRNKRKNRKNVGARTAALELPSLKFEKPTKDQELQAQKQIDPYMTRELKSPVHQEPIHSENLKLIKNVKRPLMQRVYFYLSKFATKTQKRTVRRNLYFAGVDEEAEIWIGQLILLAKLSGIAAFLLFWILFREIYILNLIVYTAITFSIVIFAGIIHLNIQMEDRQKRLENVLPDAMQVIAANIRAGMTPVVALRAAARPELGPLEEDIKLATTKSLGTESFTDALNEMARKTNSELFQRIVSLFNASLKSGGHLAQLLENTASDIRQTQELRKDLISSTRLYAIFIVFTVVIGTPLLLAVSIQFSTMVNGLQQSNPTSGIASEISSVPLITTPLSVDFLLSSAIVILIITTFLASALLGVINNGTYSSGLKYSPFLAAAAITFFFLMKDYALKAILPVG